MHRRTGHPKPARPSTQAHHVRLPHVGRVLRAQHEEEGATEVSLGVLQHRPHLLAPPCAGVVGNGGQGLSQEEAGAHPAATANDTRI